jgi:hypothetical protein
VRRLEAPGGGGVIHRVVWDLRHDPPPPEPRSDPRTVEEREAHEALPHPVTTRGPFVSPGRYTATLIAGSARPSRSFVVRGDPSMPITDSQYRGREAFLLDILATQRRIAGLLDGQGVEGDSTAPSARLARLARQIGNLADELNGNGVRQGSLYPPTETQRKRWIELDAAVETAIRESREME